MGFQSIFAKGKRIKATPKRIPGLLHYSRLRADRQLEELLVCKHVEVYYHYECQKEYTNERLIEQSKRRNDCAAEDEVPPKSLRSSTAGFEYKQQCFFCALRVTPDTRNRSPRNMMAVRTLELRDTVFPSHFTQWAGDNMDLNTFYGMGIVSMSMACGRNVTGRITDLTGIPRLKRSLLPQLSGTSEFRCSVIVFLNNQLCQHLK